MAMLSPLGPLSTCGMSRCGQAEGREQVDPGVPSPVFAGGMTSQEGHPHRGQCQRLFAQGAVVN